MQLAGTQRHVTIRFRSNPFYKLQNTSIQTQLRSSQKTNKNLHPIVGNGEKKIHSFFKMAQENNKVN